MGAYSRWALIRGWAFIRINTVLSFCLIIFPRVPEIVYQPSMFGIEQAGIAETIDFILNHFSADLQTALVQVRVE